MVAPATVWTRRLIELMEKVVSAGAGGAWDSGGRKATAWWSGAATAAVVVCAELKNKI